MKWFKRKHTIPVPGVQKVSSVRFMAGDVIIATSEFQLTPEHQQRLVAHLKDAFPGCKVLVIEPGFEIAVLQRWRYRA